jgi:uncharacterized membrane protein
LLNSIEIVRSIDLILATKRVSSDANDSHWSTDMTKTLSFAGVHFTVAFLVGYVMTGSVWVGGALALVEPACNTVAFHLHEKVWKRIERRRAGAGQPRLAA